MDEVFPDIDIENNMLVVDFEYGNGDINTERYFFEIDDNGIFLKSRRFISYRYNQDRIDNFKNINILDVEFYKMINN
ncbi:hypothetical protein MUU45_002307 [Rodentibacter pneumotropicus]|uniref:Uncharacterized protein n=1 Tax=Rodentibacter pneumotropicus TaxID=758 RepID=A0AAW5LGH7_9PAST|nr:hypothetical protein [Rodentibacter pneumotropicus]MCQ9122243.1 hypothetical protein [Rodentibacter pneumotropicus]